MHQIQADLLSKAESLTSKVAATAILWKYTDPENRIFYLAEKLLTVRSPYSGKSFTTHPERYSLGDVGKELRAEPAVAP